MAAMSTSDESQPQNPVEYLVAARAGLKGAAMAGQFGSTDTPPEIVAAIITAQATDRQTAMLKSIGDMLIDIAHSRALNGS